MTIPRTRTHRCDCEFCEVQGTEIPLTPEEVHQIEWSIAQGMARQIERDIDRWTPARSQYEATLRDAEQLTRIIGDGLEHEALGFRALIINGKPVLP